MCKVRFTAVCQQVSRLSSKAPNLWLRRTRAVTWGFSLELKGGFPVTLLRYHANLFLSIQKLAAGEKVNDMQSDLHCYLFTNSQLFLFNFAHKKCRDGGYEHQPYVMGERPTFSAAYFMRIASM